MQNPETQDRVEGQERAYVAWNEVRAFLLMTEEALKAKDVVIEEFQRRLLAAEDSKCSSTYDEEVEFMQNLVGELSAERAELRQRIEELIRSNHNLADELAILKAQIKDAISPSPALLTSFIGQQQSESKAAKSENVEEQVSNLESKLSKLEVQEADTTPNSPKIPAKKNDGDGGGGDILSTNDNKQVTHILKNT